MADVLSIAVAVIIAAVTAGKALSLRDAADPSDCGEPAMAPYTVYAETGYSGADNRYEFTLKKLPSGYRCYIDRTPSYRDRSTSMHNAHYKVDSRGKYICYTADIPYFAQARTLCRAWSNQTQRYIETGRTF